jgi:hypothetical protein
LIQCRTRSIFVHAVGTLTDAATSSIRATPLGCTNETVNASRARTPLSGSVVGGGNVLSIRISPDGSRVLFFADNDVNDVDKLYRVQIGGKALALDIDGDDRVLATTDLLMLTRYQLGMRGSALINGAVGAGATITGAAGIETNIRKALGVARPL